MNEIELMQLPSSIESFLSELKPATKIKWNFDTREYEIDNSPEAIEKQKAGCELVKSSLRDIYAFGETISRGTPKFCLALWRIYNNLTYVEDSENTGYSYSQKLNVKPSMNDYGRAGQNFTKLVAQLGLSSSSAYRYKDLGNFVDEQTGDWLEEFKGYSISLLNEIWTYASKTYRTHWLKEFAEVIPVNTTRDDMRLYCKVMQLHNRGNAPFEKFEDRKNITSKTPLPKVLKIYNKLIEQAEKEKAKQSVAATQIQTVELQPVSEYPGQLPGQTAIELEEGQPEHKEAIPDVGNGIEAQPAPMTDDELFEYCLKLESFNYIKFPIYEAFTFEVSMSEFKETVRKAYGNFYIGTICEGYSFSSDTNNSGLTSGLTIGRHNGGNKVYTWGAVTGKISKLIQADNYLTDEEKESYLKWKVGRDGVTPEPISEEEPEEDFDTYMGNHPDAYVQSHSPDVEEIEAGPRARTNREYLATLTDEQLVDELSSEILKHYKMSSKETVIFISTVKSKLTKWLSERREVTE